MKNELGKWSKEINEVSNNVWKISLTHELGPSIEKTSNNLEQLEREVELSAVEMNKLIEKKNLYKNIDLEIEKYVFLCNAEEGNYGIYELLFEFGNYDFLTLPEKMTITIEIITDLLLRDFIILEEFQSSKFDKKIKNIDFLNYSKVLNSPNSWQPSSEPIYSICITENGLKHLNEMSFENKNKLKDRLFKNK